MSNLEGLSNAETKELMFRKGKSVAGDELENLELWNKPVMTENDELIMQNAYNYEFNLTPREEPNDRDALKLPTIEEIDAIRKEAYQEGLSQGKQVGRKEGYEKGFLEGEKNGTEQGISKGHQQGLKQGIQEASDLREQINAIIHQAQFPLNLIQEEMERQLLQLVSMLAKKVIMEEIKVYPEHVLAALKMGIKALPLLHQDLKIALHQDDADLVRKYFEDQEQPLNGDIVVNSDLKPGDVIINTEFSYINLCLDKRIQKVFDELDLSYKQAINE
jgi:flagellar assembly protein FliH